MIGLSALVFEKGWTLYGDWQHACAGPCDQQLREKWRSARTLARASIESSHKLCLNHGERTPMMKNERIRITRWAVFCVFCGWALGAPQWRDRL
jgi:hypothetical protein